MQGWKNLIIRSSDAPVRDMRIERISEARRRQQPQYCVRGVWLTATEIARRAGISYQAVQQRIANDWPHDRLDMRRQPGHQQGATWHEKQSSS